MDVLKYGAYRKILCTAERCTTVSTPTGSEYVAMGDGANEGFLGGAVLESSMLVHEDNEEAVELATSPPVILTALHARGTSMCVCHYVAGRRLKSEASWSCMQILGWNTLMS